jgi:YgiT-type zinc finger domain-containing protein
MKPEICSFCKGHLKEGRTEFTVKLNGSIVSIKNVPANICNNCGEAYYNPEVSRKMDKVMAEFQKGELLAHPLAAGEIEYDKVA